MNKDKHWRAIRQQQRREKARLHKQHKPTREEVYGTRPRETTPLLEGYAAMMLNAIRRLKIKPDVDRREKHRTGYGAGNR